MGAAVAIALGDGCGGCLALRRGWETEALEFVAFSRATGSMTCTPSSTTRAACTSSTWATSRARAMSCASP